jgi:hypothetical protein
MTASADRSNDSSVFTTLVEMELTDTDRSSTSGWSSETRLSLLAWEISRYAPDLALKLSTGGKAKMAGNV